MNFVFCFVVYWLVEWEINPNGWVHHQCHSEKLASIALIYWLMCFLFQHFDRVIFCPQMTLSIISSLNLVFQPIGLLNLFGPFSTSMTATFSSRYHIRTFFLEVLLWYLKRFCETFQLQLEILCYDIFDLLRYGTFSYHSYSSLHFLLVPPDSSSLTFWIWDVLADIWCIHDCVRFSRCQAINYLI